MYEGYIEPWYMYEGYIELWYMYEGYIEPWYMYEGYTSCVYPLHQIGLTSRASHEHSCSYKEHSCFYKAVFLCFLLLSYG